MWILIIFVIIGFAVVKLLSGKKEGERGIVPSLKFKIGIYFIHLHHWLWALIIILILVCIDYFNEIIYGLLIGLIIQGLTYRDFYKIVYKN